MMYRCASPSTVAHGLLAFLLSVGCAASIAHAQSTNIVATPPGAGGLGTSLNTSGNTTNITGGTRPGGGPNLFHSFNQFSVGTGDVAAFVNPGGVSNVISRVIGGSPSNIYGTVQALNANLFFLNPSGIVFGPAAHLNVSGSAYFSTAQQLRLGDNGVFTANPNLLALDATLSSSAPAAFGFLGQGPYGSIILTSSSTLLQANAVVGLVGGPIQINGSKITAQRIIVGSTGSPGEISAQPTVGNPFSGASGTGVVQALPGTLLIAGGGGVIPASVDLLPGSITVPSGAQVNTTTNPISQRVTQIQVVQIPGQSLGALPPLPTANAGANPIFNLLDPIVFLNRAATLLPQQTPAPPAPLLASRCASQKDGQFSSLVQAPRDVTPSQPGVALTTPAVLQEVDGESEAPVKQTAQGINIPSAQLIAPWQGC